MERSERFAKLALIPTIIAIVLFFAIRGPGGGQDVTTEGQGGETPLTVSAAGDQGTTSTTPPATTSTSGEPSTTTSTVEPTTTTTTEPATATTATTAEPTTTAAPPSRPAADPSAPAAEPVGTYQGGAITLDGSVPEAALAEGFVRAAQAAVREGRVTDRLTVDPRAAAEDLTVSVVRRFAFPVGASDLEGEADVAVLADVATRFLEVWPEATLVLVGHTDAGLDAPTDLALSRAGAQLVAQRLVAEGVDDVRILVLGEGSSEPLNDGSTPEERLANRRIEVRFEGIAPR